MNLTFFPNGYPDSPIPLFIFFPMEVGYILPLFYYVCAGTCSDVTQKSLFIFLYELQNGLPSFNFSIYAAKVSTSLPVSKYKQMVKQENLLVLLMILYQVLILTQSELTSLFNLFFVSFNSVRNFLTYLTYLLLHFFLGMLSFLVSVVNKEFSYIF